MLDDWLLDRVEKGRCWLLVTDQREEKKRAVALVMSDQIESGCLNNDSTGRGNRLLIRVIARGRRNEVDCLIKDQTREMKS